MKQLKFLYSIILSCSLLSSNIFCYDEPKVGPISMDQVSQDEMDLAKLTEELMGSMTPEQRAEVDQELAKFMSLDEKDQGEYLENKFKELSVDLEKAEAMQKEEQPEIPEPQEEVKIEEPKTKPVVKAELTKVEQVNTALKKIIQHTEPLILKTKVLPQVSKDTKIATDWLSLSDNLIELNSFAKIISPKENLIDLLATEEFLLVRDQLKTIANYLEENEPTVIVPDTAGLTINYDEEDEDEAANVIVTAQNKLKIIIPKLKSLIEDDQVIWGLKRLLQKYAPEELKKVETEKKAEKKFIADFKPGKETPSTYTPKYNEPFFPNYGGSGYNPTASTTSDKPALSGSSEKGKGGKGGGGDKGDKDKGGKNKDGKDKDGKDKDGKDGKPKKDDKNKGPDLKSFNELKATLENISKIAKDNKILDLIKDDKDKDEKDSEEVYGPNGEVLEDSGAFGPKTEEQTEKEEAKLKPVDINSHDLTAPFTQINMHYDKAAKLVAKLNGSIKALPDDIKKHLQKDIKALFDNPELKLKKIDQAYKLINDTLIKRTKKGGVDANATSLTPDQLLQKQVGFALKKHTDLQDLIANKPKVNPLAPVNKNIKVPKGPKIT
ncbi:MAG: hypothetical protein P4L22_03620 [Candidatus Babeliales bacterium]|nr:hypothetical protein [Candidatus Babeliales bacterium]